LTPSPQPLSPGGRGAATDPIVSHLGSRIIGRRTLIYDSLASTNTTAAGFADDAANDGLAIVAREQTQGRGQHGRAWVSPAGAGVWLSVLLFPPPALRRPVILAAWAANSVCEAIRQTSNLQAKIKWPNDVLIHGRKVCGILVEQGKGTVVGIGLNVNQQHSDFLEHGLPDAGSLALLAGQRFECNAVAQALIRCLDEEYVALAEGDLWTLEASWKWRTDLLGKEVRVECHNVSCHGRMRDMGFDAIDLELGDGSMLQIIPETVNHIIDCTRHPDT
jgi:BirA family biotin operon repressor/biotin-[acetyl-CoA-carboxylase] ligase